MPPHEKSPAVPGSNVRTGSTVTEKPETEADACVRVASLNSETDELRQVSCRLPADDSPPRSSSVVRTDEACAVEAAVVQQHATEAQVVSRQLPRRDRRRRRRTAAASSTSFDFCGSSDELHRCSRRERIAGGETRRLALRQAHGNRCRAC